MTYLHFYYHALTYFWYWNFLTKTLVLKLDCVRLSRLTSANMQWSSMWWKACQVNCEAHNQPVDVKRENTMNWPVEGSMMPGTFLCISPSIADNLVLDISWFFIYLRRDLPAKYILIYHAHCSFTVQLNEVWSRILSVYLRSNLML